jgi:hypothetical protein
MNFAVAVVRDHRVTNASTFVLLTERRPLDFGHNVRGTIGAEKPHLAHERRS